MSHAKNTATPSSSSQDQDQNQDQNQFLYRSSRWPGRLMIATGCLHNCVGFILPRCRNPFLAAVRDGYFNQFTKDVRRTNAFWFLLAGVFMAFSGQLMNWYLFPELRTSKRTIAIKDKEVRQQQQISKYALPRNVGYWLIGISIGGAAALPISGFYLAGLQGAAILLTA
ncbi:hypothetical protein BG004_005908 [Podila humilis]|nr:hypothetical protein BG004_005908 [Podila humilis]